MYQSIVNFINLLFVDNVYTVAIISFAQSVYTANQNDGWIEPVLHLSTSSSFTISIQVFNIDGSANSEYFLTQINVIIYIKLDF